jgi:hypothetical protein
MYVRKLIKSAQAKYGVSMSKKGSAANYYKFLSDHFSEKFKLSALQKRQIISICIMLFFGKNKPLDTFYQSINRMKAQDPKKYSYLPSKSQVAIMKREREQFFAFSQLTGATAYDREYTFYHTASKVCYYLFQESSDFEADFWAKILERKNASVGDTDEFKLKMNEIRRETEDTRILY